MKRTDGRQLLIQTFEIMRVSPQRGQLSQSIKWDKNGNLYLTGRVQHADLLNGNERYYPKSVLKPQVERYIKQKINTNMAYGECDHPDSDQISLGNVCIMVKELHWEGKELIGTILVLNNRLGKDIQAIVKDGCTLSISSRGLGSLKRTDKGDEVQDDFEIICWDLVVEPSTPKSSFYNDIRESKLVDSFDSKLSQLVSNKPLINETEQNGIDSVYSEIMEIIR